MDNGDMEHMIWQCAALGCEREKVFRDNVSTEELANALHPALRHWFAPAMAPLLERSFWGSLCEGLHGNTKRILGIRRQITVGTGSKKTKRIINDNDIEVIKSFWPTDKEADHETDLPRITAAQVMAH